MQKIHLLVKKTQKQGFSHFPNRFPSRVTARKVKFVHNELFLVMIKKWIVGIIRGILLEVLGNLRVF